MTNGTLTSLVLGLAMIMASAHPLQGPRILESAANPAMPSTASYVEDAASVPAEPTETTVSALPSSEESEPTVSVGAEEGFAWSGTSDFATAVRDATTAIAAVAEEEGGEADRDSQWHCVGWDRPRLFGCWWYCTRPLFFCPCITCWA